MTLYDTSVLVAAVQVLHPEHEAAFAALQRAERQPSACSVHALSELYSVVTRMPPPYRMSPADAFSVVELIASRFTCVSLNRLEYLRFLRMVAAQGIAGGAVYDALHLQCARKIKAKTVFTLNGRDFKRLAPDLAMSIQEP